MCILRVPGLVGIAISVATATIFMMIFQPTSIYGSRALGDIFNMLHNGIVVETGNEVADSILGKAGGMNGTMWTINLILLALAYGGALERCGCVERLFGGLKHKIHSVGSLILATLLTSIFCDATMCDQFLGIGVPAPIYADKYDELGLGRNMLSRSLEDAGTLWAVMFLDRLRRLPDRRSRHEPAGVLPVCVRQPAQPRLRLCDRSVRPQHLLG